MKKPIDLKLLLLSLVCVPLVFNLVFVFVMMHLLESVDVSRSQHVHALNVGTLLGDYAAACLEGSTYAAFSRSRSEEDRRAWHGINRKIEAAKANVIHFVRNDDYVRTYLENFDMKYQRSRRKLAHSNRQMEAGLRQEAINERVSSFDANDETLRYMRPLLMRERELARIEEVEEKKKQELLQIVIIACALLSVSIAAMLMYFINKRIVDRSRHLAGLVGKIAAGADLGSRPEGADEFAKTETALYDMSVTLSQARERERSVFENAVAVIFQLSDELKVARINPACRSLWGYDEHALLGESILKVIVPPDMASARKFFAGCLDSSTEKTCEMRIKSADGVVLYAAISVSFSKTNKSLFCIAHDITEKKTIELQKEELLASVSHDVRTPMTSIQITLSLLERGSFGSVPESCRGKLEAARMSSARSIDLISDFLDLEKISARKSKPDIQVLPLEDLIDGALDAVEPELSKKRLNVQKNLPAKLHVFVDKSQYARVLRNLLKFSVAVAPEGSTVGIDCSIKDEMVTMAINFDDAGLTEPMKESLQFEKSTGMDLRKLGASGMSLALVKEIIENHGNSVDSYCNDSGRSGFKLGLPGSQKH